MKFFIFILLLGASLIVHAETIHAKKTSKFDGQGPLGFDDDNDEDPSTTEPGTGEPREPSDPRVGVAPGLKPHRYAPLRVPPPATPPSNGDAPKEDPRSGENLPKDEALQLYADFALDKLPKGTKFTFSKIAIPADSKCANTIPVQFGDKRSSCLPCLDRVTNDLGEPLRLNTYELNKVGSGWGYYTKTFTFNFMGKTGPLNVACDVPLATTLPDFVNALEKAGISMTFKRPGDAQLLQSDFKNYRPTTSSPTTSF